MIASAEKATRATNRDVSSLKGQHQPDQDGDV
jgi:hypothetical protein